MATTTIPWGDGSGDNIYLTYSSASGDQTVEVSSDANTGIARSKVVTFTSGVGNITQQLTVNQEAGVSLVFYSRLVFDGVAYIDTDIYPENNSTYRVGLGLESSENAQRVFLVDSDNGSYCGVAYGSSSNSTNRQIVPFYNSAALSANQLNQTYPTLSYFLTPKGQGWGSSYYTFTKGNTAPNGRLIIGSYHSHSGNPYTGIIGAFRIYGSDAQDVVSDSELNNFTSTVYLRPCKYNGESGLWNVDEGKFYGNSAGVGTLVAANYLSVNPSSYDSDHAYYSFQNASNAYASFTSTTNCVMVMTRGSQAETYVYFKFDTSSIPENATILRVFCSAGAAKSSTNANVINSATIQLYSGTSAKGTAKSITSTNRTLYKIACGTWTRQELENVSLKIYGKRGTSNANTNHNLYLYGATLYVLYTD